MAAFIPSFRAFRTLPVSALWRVTLLSGGQWQRIALARAVLRRSEAELLILDEPTAALDPTFEHEVYGLLRELAQGRTTLVISHRLALARLADRVVVVEHGMVIEEGRHASLMARGGRYADMFTRQASSYRDEEHG